MRNAKVIIPKGFDVSQMQAVDMPVSQIVVPDDMRISINHVAGLKVSIEERGLLEPLQARKVKHRKNQILLLHGAHRLQAIKELGWETVPVFVWDMNDDQAADVALSSKVGYRPAPLLEFAYLLLKQKELYEKRHPSSKRGTAGAVSRWGKQTKNMSFVVGYAEAIGKTPRQVQRYIQCVEGMTPDELSFLLSLPKSPTGAELTDFAKLHSLENGKKLRKEVLRKMRDGECARLVDAVATVKPNKKSQASSPDESAYLKLLTAWKRAPKAMQARFIEDQGFAKEAEPEPVPPIEDQFQAVWDQMHDGLKMVMFDKLREEMDPASMTLEALYARSDSYKLYENSIPEEVRKRKRPSP